jgi:ADP-heptose:LPS heptosyltransferase
MIADRVPDARIHAALGWPLAEVIAVLAEARFCVANNTGVMNLSGAVMTRTYGIFGTTYPFDHASEIRRILAPEIGVDDGVSRIPLQAVSDAIITDRGGLAP